MTALASGRVPLINATKRQRFALAQVVLTLAWASGRVLISNPVHHENLVTKIYFVAPILKFVISSALLNFFSESSMRIFLLTGQATPSIDGKTTSRKS